MLRRKLRRWKRRSVAACLASGLAIGSAGGCNLSDITATSTTTVTLSASEAILTILQGLIITPLNDALTNAVNNYFGENEED